MEAMPLDDGRDRGETPVGVVDTDETPGNVALLPADDDDAFQRSWEAVQARFLDEPRSAVEQADELVAEVMERLAAGFADARDQLEDQWSRGEEVSREDLLVALRRYRAFFRRMLSA